MIDHELFTYDELLEAIEQMKLLKKQQKSHRKEGKKYIIARGDMIEKAKKIKPPTYRIVRNNDNTEWEYNIGESCQVNIYLMKHCNDPQKLCYKKSEKGLYGFIPQQSILLHSLALDGFSIHYHEKACDIGLNIAESEKEVLAKYSNITYIDQQFSCTLFSRDCRKEYFELMTQCDGMNNTVLYIDNDKSNDTLILYNPLIKSITFDWILSNRPSGHYVTLYGLQDKKRTRGDQIGCFMYRDEYIQY